MHVVVIVLCETPDLIAKSVLFTYKTSAVKIFFNSSCNTVLQNFIKIQYLKCRVSQTLLLIVSTRPSLTHTIQVFIVNLWSNGYDNTEAHYLPSPFSSIQLRFYNENQLSWDFLWCHYPNSLSLYRKP